ncbi:MAG: M14 family zinc carboxypeptidase [Bacteroidetes bacterium]|nr:M14 family zinc carboxypeptidase [Bacteroidota bacterium]
MKHILYILSLLILPALLSAQIYQEVKVHASRGSIRTIASLGIAVDEGIYRNGTWGNVLSEGEVAKIRYAGFTVDVIRQNYSKYISERNKSALTEIREINKQIRTKSAMSYPYPVPVHFELGSMGGYYTLNEVLNELDSMRYFYPNLISTKAAVGSMLTVEGRNVYYVKISNTPDANTAKPRIQYNSLIHAREPMGMQQLMFFMWYLLENYNTNAEVKYLIDNLELYFIPVMNPDGYAYNFQTEPYGGGMWRKNRKNTGSGYFGVDLNRNFSYQWGYDDIGSSPDPWAETYRGSSAFSETETRDFRDFCMAKTFKMVYNYHTYADETMYPWCYITEPTPDSLTEYAFTGHMMAKNGYVSGTPGLVLYNTNGDALDWEYGEATLKPSIICFTTETGNDYDGFWPMVGRILPLAEENVYANLEAAWLTLPYAEVTDMGTVINPKRDGYFPFRFKRLGLTGNTDYTVSVKPLDTLLFASVGPAKIIHNPVQHALYTDSVSYSLKPGIRTGQPYRYIWQIDNGLTITSDTVTKYYGWPMVLLNDSCNTMDNWTSGYWNTSTRASHSAFKSLADSPIGPYSDYIHYNVSLKNKITITESPVAVIEFWVRYGIEKSMDYAQFSTSLNNGSSWTKQSTRYTNNGSTQQDFPNPIYDGFTNWDQDRVLLQNTAGGELLAMFSMNSNSNMIEGDGVYVDDFKVSVVDMTFSVTDPGGSILGFISGPMPNPAIAGLIVNYQLPCKETGNCRFQLFDSRSVMLKELPLTSSEGSIKFDVTDLPSGIYLYRIKGDFGTTAVKKLVVAH